MKNKVIIVLGAIIILIIGIVLGAICGDKKHTYSINDGTIGVAFFENLSDEVGYGIGFQEGKVPINVAIYNGTVKVTITKGENKILDEEFDKAKDITIDIPETGYYKVMISGKNATGIFKYPVVENTNSNMDEIPEL